MMLFEWHFKFKFLLDRAFSFFLLCFLGIGLCHKMKKLFPGAPSQRRTAAQRGDRRHRQKDTTFLGPTTLHMYEAVIYTCVGERLCICVLASKMPPPDARCSLRSSPLLAKLTRLTPSRGCGSHTNTTVGQKLVKCFCFPMH